MSMLPGNAKCSMTLRYMTSLADTKHIFIDLCRIEFLHLAKSTRGSRDARALCARRDYKLASPELHNIIIFL